MIQGCEQRKGKKEGKREGTRSAIQQIKGEELQLEAEMPLILNQENAIAVGETVNADLPHSPLFLPV